MTALTFAPFSLLTKEQAMRVWQIWHDTLPPTEYVYQLQGDQVVGRAALLKKARGKAAQFSEFEMAPDTVKSSRVAPKPISTRDVLHELPHAMRPAPAPSRARASRTKPKPRRGRSPYTRTDLLRGLFLMAVLAAVYAWIYLT